MSAQIGQTPSIKYKKRHRPNRTISQPAPLATHDDFMCSEYDSSVRDDDSEAVPHHKMKQFHSVDEASISSDNIFSCRDADQIKEEDEVIGVDNENVAEMVEREEEEYEEEEEEEVVENDEQISADEESSVNDDYESFVDEVIERAIEIIKNELESCDETDDKYEIEVDEDYDKFEFEDHEEEPDEVKEEYRDDEEDEEVEYDPDELDEDGLPREMYYDNYEDDQVVAGDDPFSLEYLNQSVTNNTQDQYGDSVNIVRPNDPNYDPDTDAPKIVITEPSDSDLSNMDGSKALKPTPMRPEPPKGPSKQPRRPPAPPTKGPVKPPAPKSASTAVKSKAKSKDEEPLDETKFPFKSHFEKKHIVPNPKKAIINVLKGESKKERRRKKEEAQFDKLLKSNKFNPNLEQKKPTEQKTSDDWKAYNDLQARISASVAGTQQKIKPTQPEEKELNEKRVETNEVAEKEDNKLVDFFEASQTNNTDNNWANFGDASTEDTKEDQKVLDIFSDDFNSNTKEDNNNENSDLNSFMNKNDLAEFDIWSTGNQNDSNNNKTTDPIETEPKEVEKIKDDKKVEISLDSTKKIDLYEDPKEFIETNSAFLETFNQRIEENEEDDGDPFLAALSRNKDKILMDDNEEYKDDEVKEDTSKIIEVEAVENSEETTKPKERPKPKRQETLSGNNPFRKGSSSSSEEDPKNKEIIAPADKITSNYDEEESPFIAVLKSVGIKDLDPDTPPESGGFDPLTTIYPDESGDEKEPVKPFEPEEQDRPVMDQLTLNNFKNEISADSHSSRSSDSEDDDSRFGVFRIKTPVKIIDAPKSTEAQDLEIVALPCPTTNTPTAAVKGPRERKVQEDGKPFQKKKKEKEEEVEKMFENLRTNADEDISKEADTLKEPEDKVIKFESPLSATFGTQEIEWEAFPTPTNQDQAAVEGDSAFGPACDEDVWGETAAEQFQADFEPLPGEIIEFEPYFPKVENPEWKLMIRQPEKKSKTKQISRYTTNRWWREIYVRLGEDKDRPCLRLYENLEDDQPYRTVRLEPYMQLSKDKMQQYDKYGKLHIFKVNHIIYKEMVGMRTEKFSLKSLQNLVSHKPKMNMVLDHMPVRTEVVKFGSLDQQPLRSLMNAIIDSMMTIKTHRDTSLEYTKEEVCCYVNDEYECELSTNGSIITQKARTRVHFAAFVTGQPYIVLGINDKWRYGNEIVSRKDIIPIMHDDWISIYEPEFHGSVDMVEYEKDHMIKFYPLDGCKFELMRFRVPLRENKELPLSAMVTFKVDGARVDIRVDMSVPGFFSASRRHGAVHCEAIEVRIPIPEQWAYHLRIERHTKFGSAHSVSKKPGKIRGFERISQFAQSLVSPGVDGHNLVLETSCGLAKYEHLYRALVWRIPRLPDKVGASYKPHLLNCRIALAPQDDVPSVEEMTPNFDVEFTMSASTVSGATIRSISIEHTTTPERFVKYLATFKYKREIDYQYGRVKQPAIVSILDQVEPTKKSSLDTEGSRKDSSASSTANNQKNSQDDDRGQGKTESQGSFDLLNNTSDPIKPNSDTKHSALDDLLTLDFNTSSTITNQNTVNDSATGNLISGGSKLFDDIAMVDD